MSFLCQSWIFILLLPLIFHEKPVACKAQVYDPVEGLYIGGSGDEPCDQGQQQGRGYRPPNYPVPG